MPFDVDALFMFAVDKGHRPKSRIFKLAVNRITKTEAHYPFYKLGHYPILSSILSVHPNDEDK